MASDSADQALSRDVISFAICGKIWRLGDPIHSTEIGAIKKTKMAQSLANTSPPQESKESLWNMGPARKIV
jgi:hypothetical protein